jgi:hypothetical protein
MRTETTDFARWWMVAVFAAAMAGVEAAVVFYVRTMIHRIEPYQPDPLPVLGGFGSVELPRELATLIMLFAVGWLAGPTWRARLGYFAIAFGTWDIFYYVFLKIISGWPHSLLDWDILFLLPLPWWGPVLAPVLISLLLILWGTVACQFPEISPATAFNRRGWTLSFLGAVLALYVFMGNALTAAPNGLDAIRTALPERFHWRLFGVALVLMAAPLIEACKQMALHRPRPFATVVTDPKNPCNRA